MEKLNIKNQMSYKPKYYSIIKNHLGSSSHLSLEFRLKTGYHLTQFLADRSAKSPAFQCHLCLPIPISILAGCAFVSASGYRYIGICIRICGSRLTEKIAKKPIMSCTSICMNGCGTGLAPQSLGSGIWFSNRCRRQLINIMNINAHIIITGWGH